jgi:predicted transcriptional regulator
MEMSEFSRMFTQNRGKIHKNRLKIVEILEEGPCTISDIHERMDLEKKLIVWNMLGLLRWGKVEVSGEKDNELVYSIKEL